MIHNPNEEFLAVIKERHSTKKRELRRLLDYVRSFEAQLAAEARYIELTEQYVRTEEDQRDHLISGSSVILAEGAEKLSHSETVLLESEAVGSDPFLPPRKKRRAYKGEGTESAKLRRLAVDVIRLANRVLTGPEILAGIEALGHPIDSKNPAELAKKAFRKAEGLVRSGRGYWLAGEDLPDQHGPSTNKRRHAG